MATSSSASRCKTRLSAISAKELAAIRKTMRRRNITTSLSSPMPIKRDIDYPECIIPLVHIRKNTAVRGIFDRDDILVNPEDSDRQKSQSHKPTAYSTSPHDSPRSRSRCRSRSAESKRKIQDRGSLRERDETNGRSPEKERDRISERVKESTDRPYSKERSFSSDDERYRRRSRTPLRHLEASRRRPSRDADYSRDKYRRSRSLSEEYHRSSTISKTSRSPRRSTARDRDRQESPRYERSNARRSRSLQKSTVLHYKRGREPSPGYKDPTKGRSQSPRYEKERKRSITPGYVDDRTKSRYERHSLKRYSRSPSRYKRRPSPNDRCRSPYSPLVSLSRSRSGQRPSSRSPGYDRKRTYDRRSRSRSPKKRLKVVSP